MTEKFLLFLGIAGLGIYANWLRLRGTISGYRRRPPSDWLSHSSMDRPQLVRRLRIAVSAFCAMLEVALCVLWVRSYWQQDSFTLYSRKLELLQVYPNTGLVSILHFDFAHANAQGPPIESRLVGVVPHWLLVPIATIGIGAPW